VINLHGEAGLRSRCDEWYDGEMESIYPNFIPEEGFLPLSKGAASPSCGPTLDSPGSAPAPMPMQVPPAGGQEPIPTPRQSPEASRPANGRYTEVSNSQAVTQTRYLAPPLTMPAASGK
jgi:hypothetical protein